MKLSYIYEVQLRERTVCNFQEIESLACFMCEAREKEWRHQNAS